MCHAEPEPTAAQVQRIAFEELSDIGKMMKIEHHLSSPLGVPVPAAWVRWLLDRMAASECV